VPTLQPRLGVADCGRCRGSCCCRNAAAGSLLLLLLPLGRPAEVMWGSQRGSCCWGAGMRPMALYTSCVV
jgi:hypothetical protein